MTGRGDGCLVVRHRPLEDYREIARLLRDQVDLPDDPDWYATMNMVLAAASVAAREHPALAYERRLDHRSNEGAYRGGQRGARSRSTPWRLRWSAAATLRGGVFPGGTCLAFWGDDGDGAPGGGVGRGDRRTLPARSRRRHRRLPPAPSGAGGKSCRRCRRRARSSSWNTDRRRNRRMPGAETGCGSWWRNSAFAGADVLHAAFDRGWRRAVTGAAAPAPGGPVLRELAGARDPFVLSYSRSTCCARRVTRRNGCGITRSRCSA